MRNSKIIIFLLLFIASAQLEKLRKHLRPFLELEDEMKYKMISKTVQFPYQKILLNDDMMFYKCTDSNELRFPKKFTRVNRYAWQSWAEHEMLLSDGHMTFLNEFCNDNENLENFEIAADNSRIVSLNKSTGEARGKWDPGMRMFDVEFLDANAQDFFPKDIKDALFGNEHDRGIHGNDNIVKLLLKYEYPFAPVAADDVRKYFLYYPMEFHSRVTQYEKLFYVFDKRFPKSTLQLAKMLENVNDSFRPKRWFSSKSSKIFNQATLFQQAVIIRNPFVVSYMIKNRKPNLDDEFLWFCPRLVRKPILIEERLVNILWFTLHKPGFVYDDDGVAETFKALVEGIGDDKAKKMINTPYGSQRQTCLHLAAEMTHNLYQVDFATFKFLIKIGADVLLTDKDGNTAFDIVLRNQNARKDYFYPKGLTKIARYLHKKVKQAQKNKISLTISKQKIQEQSSLAKWKMNLRKN